MNVFRMLKVSALCSFMGVGVEGMQTPGVPCWVGTRTFNFSNSEPEMVLLQYNADNSWVPVCPLIRNADETHGPIQSVEVQDSNAFKALDSEDGTIELIVLPDGLFYTDLSEAKSVALGSVICQNI